MSWSLVIGVEDFGGRSTTIKTNANANSTNFNPTALFERARIHIGLESGHITTFTSTNKQLSDARRWRALRPFEG